MKLYYVGPNCDPETMSEAAIEAVTSAAIEPIANLVWRHLGVDGFRALIGLTVLNRPWPDPTPDLVPPYPPLEAGQEAFGRYRVSRFASDEEVRAALLNMGNPNPRPSPMFFLVRSILSCRSVTYGFDGQAFLCLHTEDPAPTSPDPALVVVWEATELITQTDYLDGVARIEDW
ncbi:MAG TPA: hypothetical protein VG939_18150 [Caulobacteraceae bacterium]|nr:hypothetical protein [Caulobacteraceae bacterium]